MIRELHLPLDAVDFNAADALYHNGKIREANMILGKIGIAVSFVVGRDGPYAVSVKQIVRPTETHTRVSSF